MSITPAINLPITCDDVAPVTGSGYPERCHSRMDQATWRALGDHFGLTQSGGSHETLQPGPQSSVRHWHTLVDEFVQMIDGELVLCANGGEFVLRPGMCVGFKAADTNAHHRLNRSQGPSQKAASFIAVGSNVPGDEPGNVPLYPDEDLAVFNTEAGRIAVHKDGTPCD